MTYIIFSYPSLYCKRMKDDSLSYAMEITLDVFVTIVVLLW